VLWWLAGAAVFWIMCGRAESNPFFTVDIAGLGWQDMLQPVVAFLLLAPLVIAPRTRSVLHRALSWRAIAWMGTISYGAYLWHARILDLDLVKQVMHRDGAGHGYPALLIGTLLALALTTLVAAASWYALERPIIRWGQRRDRRGESRELASRPLSG
jgi:peptidoglycan/LPS O-acetylase OafA/YrhL